MRPSPAGEVRNRRTAAAEALRARWWYAAFSEDAEASFSAALEAAFALIRDNPASGVPLFDAFRRVPVSGYPYAVVYRLRGNELLLSLSRTRAGSRATGNAGASRCGILRVALVC